MRHPVHSYSVAVKTARVYASNQTNVIKIGSIHTERVDARGLNGPYLCPTNGTRVTVLNAPV